MPAPWPEAFALMWEAYSAGTVPVGAVIVDEGGSIVTQGRNRIFDDGAHSQLGRTRLAHAEMNALIALPSDRTYETWTLYTTLEPCHVCLSATIMCRVGALRYAANDPYGGGVGKLLPSADHLAHPVTVNGPVQGAAGLLPELLYIAHFLWRVPDGDVGRFYRRAHPQLANVAASVPAPGAGGSLADAFAQAAAHTAAVASMDSE